MMLFNFSGFDIHNEPKNSIETPLGEVFFDLDMEEVPVSTKHATAAFSSNNNEYLTEWHTSCFDAELLICHPKLNLPSHMKVDGCIAAVWRLMLNKDTSGCSFSASWDDDYKWTDGGPDSGEHLDAQTWNNENNVVTIGTQDGEMLLTRAYHGDMMPAIFAADIEPLALVQYTSRGLIVPIPNIISNRICQVHFVVAWTEMNINDVSTWYAADLLPQDILGNLLD